jgi:hypothetical protein
MVSSTRQAIACIVFIVAIAANAQAQTTPAKDQTASISGKVTLKEKAAPAIVVVLTEDKYAAWQRSGIAPLPTPRATIASQIFRPAIIMFSRWRRPSCLTKTSRNNSSWWPQVRRFATSILRSCVAV